MHWHFGGEDGEKRGQLIESQSFLTIQVLIRKSVPGLVLETLEFHAAASPQKVLRKRNLPCNVQISFRFVKFNAYFLQILKT